MYTRSLIKGTWLCLLHHEGHVTLFFKANLYGNTVIWGNKLPYLAAIYTEEWTLVQWLNAEEWTLVQWLKKVGRDQCCVWQSLSLSDFDQENFRILDGFRWPVDWMSCYFAYPDIFHYHIQEAPFYNALPSLLTWSGLFGVKLPKIGTVKSITAVLGSAGTGKI